MGSDGLTGPALSAFMDWWATQPGLTGIEARYMYFSQLLVRANRLEAERNLLRLRLRGVHEGLCAGGICFEDDFTDDCDCWCHKPWEGGDDDGPDHDRG